jgi:hypothetical protein
MALGKSSKFLVPLVKQAVEVQTFLNEKILRSLYS